jgi:arylsulfatase A-like enzyme
LSALDAAPRGKETLIAITADTGRERRATTEGRENVPHALHLYEETVRVPLILRYPLGAELAAAPWRGTRIDIAVQNHRLFATFLEASGARLPENRRLHSLGDRNTLIFTEARHPPTGEKPSDGQHRDFRALYLFPFKLIQDASGISEYYNLDDDPNEEHNIREKAPKSYSRLLKMIIQFAEAHPPLFHDQEEDESNVWQASVDTLEELGTVE